VNHPPVADAGADQESYAGNVLSFNGSQSSDPDGDVLEHTWDFGDGNNATGVTPTHAFTSPGIYHVVVTVTDSHDASSTDTCIVTVTPVLFISQIDMSLLKYWFYISGQTVVTITDQNGQPVSNAVVTGHWSGLTNDTDSPATNSSGKATCMSDYRWSTPGTFTFTVDNVSKAGYHYAPERNVETSDSVSR